MTKAFILAVLVAVPWSNAISAKKTVKVQVEFVTVVSVKHGANNSSIHATETMEDGTVVFK